MTNADLSQQLSYLIARVNRMVEDDLTRRLQPDGFSIDQFRILKVLDHERPLAMGELAARVLVEPATLTKIIDRMVSEGLVVRLPDPADRRRVLVSLGPAGERSARDLLKIGRDHEERIAQGLPKRDLQRIRQILSDLSLD
ncbi:MarR family transcriptional regulator [Paracoccus sp. YIM 132242]|uniref:MarR family transcriptional regulator n=1 Tax=Paracoccus lichenicola TaxID=2665644 RepID=A0A6L6HVZ1_9RHOB|nr:MarR family transcriptional regulator [Paracoccus lichenicola]MTE01478.1 MarR family transcriptional regulator [Paracoccus lichenicola]